MTITNRTFRWAGAGFAAACLVFVPVSTVAQPQPAAPAPTVVQRVEEAYRYGDFAELERLYARYGKAGVRSELTGVPRLTHFWSGISRVDNSDLAVTDEYYQQLDALTGQWADRNPQSVLAQLLHAHALKAHAWVHRGGGYANSVAPADWAQFRQFLAQAQAQLLRAQALAAHDSSWNRLMLGVGLGLEWDRARMMALFNDGIARNPDDDGLYILTLDALLPKWGGDLATVDRFIADAVRKTRAQRGLEMYALLYAEVSYQEASQSLFTGTRASWPSMKAGFEDLLRRYPHVDHRNKFAYFACMADDRPTLQQQLDLIGDAFVGGFWGHDPERRFEACRKLAQQA